MAKRTGTPKRESKVRPDPRILTELASAEGVPAHRVDEYVQAATEMVTRLRQKFPRQIPLGGDPHDDAPDEDRSLMNDW